MNNFFKRKGRKGHKGIIIKPYYILCVTRNFGSMRTPWLIIFIFLSITAYSQTGVSLETEIQDLERSIARQGISEQERHANLVCLAQLHQLSGNIETAARNWLEAARAIPGNVDDDALLNCSYCLAAMGEWDRACTVLEPLLSKSARARFLNTGIIAITTKNTAALAALADNPAYAQFKSEIYFLLWKLSAGQSAERWRQRLNREFPHSPETLLASGGTLETGQTVLLRQSPFWLFINGLDSLPLMPSVAEGRPAPAQTPVPPTPVPTPAPAPSSFIRLQTGIYSREANAQAQAQRLRQAGFTPTIEERDLGGNKMWAVTVPAQEEQKLKTAGIEYFPLR